jgi:hypothetical protein
MRTFKLIALACFAMSATGCGIKEETIKVVQMDVMVQVKSTLQNYVNGQPVTSEVTSFDYMVNEVRNSSPEKADILKAGLEDLKSASGAALKSKAKALMAKLGIEAEAPKK